MVRIASRTGPDMVAGDTIGVMVMFDGRCVLSSRNRFPSPDLRDFDARGRPEFWEVLGAAPGPKAWNWYDKSAGSPIYSKQNGTGFPVTKTHHEAGPIVIGAPIPDPTKQARIAPPGRPRVVVVNKDRVGHARGWRGLAIGWITGDAPNSPALRRLTAPGPRATLFVEQGQSIRYYLYEDVPKGATAYAFYETGPRDTELLAQTATLYFQGIKDLKRDNGVFVDHHGPFLNADPRANNKTFIGAANVWPGPSVALRSAEGNLDIGATQVGFLFRTRSGLSKMQQTTAVPAQKGSRRAIFFRPTRVPYDSPSWVPMFLGLDGQWYQLGERRIDSPARLYTNDPAKFPPANKPDQVAPDTLEDTTGVIDPQEEIPKVEAFGAAQISPGRHSVRATWGLEDEDGTWDESAPSPPVAVDLLVGQTFRIFRPPTANVGSNPEFVQRDAVDPSKPIHWNVPAVPGVITVPQQGVSKTRDTSGSTGRSTVIGTPDARHDNNDRRTVTHRIHALAGAAAGVRVVAMARITKLGGAIVRRVIKDVVAGVGAFAEEAGVPVAQLEATGDPGSAVSLAVDPEYGEELEVTVGPVGSGADVEEDGVEESSVEFDFDGGGVTARDATLELRNWNAFDGFVAGRKRHDEEEDAGTAGIVAAGGRENYLRPYLEAGYCKVVKDPKASERPVALNGLVCNMIEYYGPYATPATEVYGPRGLKIPVKPGTQSVFSVYLWWKGVTRAATPLRIAVKDSRGRTIRLLPPMVSFGGSSSTVAGADARGWIRRSAPFTADANAAYIEFVGSPMGDGLIRLMGFQYEQDRLAPTEFTAENGVYGEMIGTYDTGVPAPPEAQLMEPFAAHGMVKRLVRAGGIHTADEAGTAVSYDFSCKKRADAVWGPWVATIAELATHEQLRVRAKLTTTNTANSPEVSELFVDLERHQPVLTREDGSEFPGGVVATDVSIPHTDRPIQEREYADFSDGFRVLGKEKRVLEYGLEAYLDEGAEEVEELQGIGESLFCVEHNGSRYKVRQLRARFADPDRGVTVPIRGRSSGLYIHQAERVSSRIVGEGGI